MIFMFMDNMHRLISLEKIKYKPKTITYYCELHKKEITQRNDVFIKSGCKACNKGKNHSLTHKEYLNRFSKSNIQGEYEVINVYKNAKTKIKIKHKICNNEYEVLPSKFLSGDRCPKCRNLGLTMEEFNKKYVKLLSNYELLSFTKITDKLLFLHKNCGNKFNMKGSKFITGQRCPKCSKSNSKMEAKTLAFLEINKINYKKECKFIDCLSDKGYKLRFDFAIFNENGDLKILIECDGEQHSNEKKGNILNKNLLINDKIKNEYCIKNGYVLLRISYLDEKNIFKILKSNIGGGKLPSLDLIDIYYNKKVSHVDVSKIRNEFLNGIKREKLIEKFKLNRSYINMILCYSIFDDQDLEIEEIVRKKANSRNNPETKLKFYKYKNEFEDLYKYGFSYKAIGKMYTTYYNVVKNLINLDKKFVK